MPPQRPRWKGVREGPFKRRAFGSFTLSASAVKMMGLFGEPTAKSLPPCAMKSALAAAPLPGLDLMTVPASMVRAWPFFT